jgi:Flp pilus assembly secretin CpaC
VVGGFITETSATDKRGIPVLSGIPGLGSAFSTGARARIRTELVFLVTVNAQEPPELVPVDADGPAGGPPPGAPAPVERIGIGGDAS